MNGGGWAVWPFDKLRIQDERWVLGCLSFDKLRIQDERWVLGCLTL